MISLVDASMRKATRQLQQQIGVAEVIEPADPRRLTVEVARPDDHAFGEHSPERCQANATAAPARSARSSSSARSAGYGFIARPDADDLFVHHTNIAVKGAKSAATLIEGQRVRYTIGAGRRGPEAIAVTLA